MNVKNYSYQDYVKNAEIIRGMIGDFQPEVLLILGSGLGFLGDVVEDPIYVDYHLNPEVGHSFAPGHKGRFVFGRLAGRNVVVMQGRLHCYEGYTMEQVAMPVRVMKLLGVSKMIITNAAGCTHTEWNVGDLMLISDHIKLTVFSPLTGNNIPEFGPKFPDMTFAYSERLRDLAREVAEEQGLMLREGVYMYFPGPQFETPAEVRASKVLGADANGMSTVAEVIVANHCGIETLGITLLTNMCAGLLREKLSSEEVNRAAGAASERFAKLVCGVLERM